MSRKDYYYNPDSPQANSIVPAASAVVVDEKGNILLHQRTDNQYWSLPGGGMDVGESIEETIIREVKEETGFDVEVIRCIGIYTNPNHVISYPDGEVRQQFSICFACKIVGGELSVSSESHQVRFFDPLEIKKLDIHPANLLRIEDYYKQDPKAFIR